MPAQLPMHLVQLESLPSALDLLRYLAKHPERAAWPEEIMDDLQISERRYSKAMRRLVTNNYTQMRGDNRFELTRKGEAAAEELAAYDAEAPASNASALGKIQRTLVVALPRQLAAGQPTDVLVGFEPVAQGFTPPADVVVRFEALHADISTHDQRLKLSRAAEVCRLTLTPSFYDAVRLKLQVFQLSEDGEDLTNCGGTYIDVDVVAAQPNNILTAYSSEMTFKV
jgi:DNA-binding MarR family transcriptional regulator